MLNYQFTGHKFHPHPYGVSPIFVWPIRWWDFESKFTHWGHFGEGEDWERKVGGGGGGGKGKKLSNHLIFMICMTNLWSMSTF